MSIEQDPVYDALLDIVENDRSCTIYEEALKDKTDGVEELDQTLLDRYRDLLQECDKGNEWLNDNGIYFDDLMVKVFASIAGDDGEDCGDQPMDEEIEEPATPPPRAPPRTSQAPPRKPANIPPPASPGAARPPPPRSAAPPAKPPAASSNVTRPPIREIPKQVGPPQRRELPKSKLVSRVRDNIAPVVTTNSSTTTPVPAVTVKVSQEGFGVTCRSFKFQCGDVPRYELTPVDMTEQVGGDALQRELDEFIFGTDEQNLQDIDDFYANVVGDHKQVGWRATIKQIRQDYKLADNKKITYKPETTENVEDPKDKRKKIQQTVPAKLVTGAIGKGQIAFKQEDVDKYTDLYNLYTDYEKKWLDKAGDKNFHLCNLLTCSFVQTPLVLNLAEVNKASTKKLTIDDDYLTFGPTGIPLDLINHVSEETLMAIATTKQGMITDYYQLFNDIQGFTTTGMPHVKKFYDSRDGIIKHPHCSDEFKKMSWEQAWANVYAINTDGCTDDEKACIEAWKNILGSPYVFYIVMYGISPSKFFSDCFNDLLEHGTTAHLLLTALYPISFVFGPYMLGRPSEAGYSEITGTTKYKAEVTKLYKSFCDMPAEISDNAVYDTDFGACNWLYYSWINRIRNGKEQCGIKAVYGAIFNLPTGYKEVKQREAPAQPKPRAQVTRRKVGGK